MVGKLSNAFRWKGTSEEGLWRLAAKAVSSTPAGYRLPASGAACALPLLAHCLRSSVSIHLFVSYLLSFSWERLSCLPFPVFWHEFLETTNCNFSQGYLAFILSSRLPDRYDHPVMSLSWFNPHKQLKPTQLLTCSTPKPPSGMGERIWRKIWENHELKLRQRNR